MSDTELDAVRKITPAIAAEYLQMLHSAEDIRIGLQLGICPFGFALKRPGRSKWEYHIDNARLKKYRRGEFPMMGAPNAGV